MSLTRIYDSSGTAVSRPGFGFRRRLGSGDNLRVGQASKVDHGFLLRLGLILLPAAIVLALVAWKQPTFRDEAVTLLAIEGVVKTGLPRMPNGSLYGHGVLWTYIAAIPGFLFGVQMWSVRLASVAAGIALVASVYLLSRRLIGEKAASWAALFTLVNAKVLYFSSIGRMYVGAMLFIGLTIVLMAVWVKENRPRWLWMAGASYVAGVLTYEIAPYYALAAAICLPLALPRSRLLEWRLPVVGSIALAATLFRLLLVRLWEPTVLPTISAAYAPSLEFGARELHMLQHFFGSDRPMIYLTLAFALSLAPALRVPWARYLAAVAMTASVLVIIMPGNEAIRYLLPTLPLLAIIAGYGVSKLIPGRMVATVGAWALLGLLVLSIWNHAPGEVRAYFLPGEDSNGWIAAAEAAKPLIKSGDAIVASEPRNIYYVFRRLDGFVLPQQGHMVVNGKNIHIDAPLMSGLDVWKLAEWRTVWLFAQDARVENSAYGDLIRVTGGRDVLSRLHVHVYRIAAGRTLTRRQKFRAAIDKNAPYLAADMAVSRLDYSQVGKQLIENGDPKTAIRVVRSGLDIYGGDALLLTRLSDAYGKLGRTDAVKALQTRLRQQKEAEKKRQR